MAGIDRRTECRYAADCPCTVGYKVGLGLVEVPARIIDISVRGARLLLSQDVPDRIIVSVTLKDLPNKPLFGQIVYIGRDSKTTRRVGLRLVDGTFPFDVFRTLMGDATSSRHDPLVPECYRRLGLAFPSQAQDVHHAFRQKAMVAHPDHGGSARDFMDLYTAYREALDLCS